MKCSWKEWNWWDNQHFTGYTCILLLKPGMVLWYKNICSLKGVIPSKWNKVKKIIPVRPIHSTPGLRLCHLLDKKIHVWGHGIFLCRFKWNYPQIYAQFWKHSQFHGAESPETFKSYTKENKSAGPGCSKLTTSLVNVSLNFQKLISQICQYFFVEKMWEAFAVQKLLSFFQQKISVYLVIKL